MYKCKDMVKYKKIFLDKIKLFLLYLVEFFEDGSIIFKKYTNDYIVGRLNKKNNYYNYI